MSGVILKVSKDQTAPDGLVDKLLDKFTQTIGVAVVENGELKLVHSDEGADKEVFKLVLKDYLDTDLFIYLGDRKPNSLEMQPYVLLKDAASKPMLVSFLVGDFDKHIPKGGSHSAEWYAVESDLLSRIRDTFDLCGSDMAKLMERLKTNQLLERDLRRLYGEWGTITFLANNGEHHTIETGTKTLDAEWGWVTDPVGYAEASQTHQTDAKPRPFTLQNFRRAVAGAISPDKPAVAPIVPPPTTKPPGPAPAAPPPTISPKAAPTLPTAKKPTSPAAAPTVPSAAPTAPPVVSPKASPAPPPAAPPKVVEQDGEILIPKVELTDAEKFVQCPADITKSAAIQAFYRREAGFLPPNFKEHPKVPISNRKQKVKLQEKAKQVVKSFREMGDVIQNGGTKTAPAIPTSPVPQIPNAMPKVPPMVPTGKEKEYPDTGTQHIPEEIEVGILSAAQKKALNEFISDGKIIKMIDKHSKVVANPADLQAFEEKRPSFTDVTGLDLNDMWEWPPQVLLLMAKHDPAWAERLMTQAIYERHCMQLALNRKEKTEEVQPATPTTKPAGMPAVPVVAPPAVQPPKAAPPAARRQVA